MWVNNDTSSKEPEKERKKERKKERNTYRSSNQLLYSVLQSQRNRDRFLVQANRHRDRNSRSDNALSKKKEEEEA
jgi:hypothetical protein